MPSSLKKVAVGRMMPALSFTLFSEKGWVLWALAPNASRVLTTDYQFSHYKKARLGLEGFYEEVVESAPAHFAVHSVEVHLNFVLLLVVQKSPA